jgi:hypothetical protein
MTVKRILVILAALGVLAGGTAAATATTHATAADSSWYHA